MLALDLRFLDAEFQRATFDRVCNFCLYRIKFLRYSLWNERDVIFLSVLNFFNDLHMG